MSLSSPLIAKRGDPVLLDQRRRHVVLRGERVRGAEDDVGAARLQRAGEVRRLGRDVEAGRDAEPGKRLLALEPLADRREHGHLPVGPLDPPHAFGGERQILHVVSLRLPPSFLSSFGVDRRVQAASWAVSSRSCFALLPLDPGGCVWCRRSGRSSPPATSRPAARRSGSRRSRSGEGELAELDAETPACRSVSVREAGSARGSP